MKLWRAVMRPRAAWSQPPFWSLPTPVSGLLGERERIATDFDGIVEGAYKGNGVIMTCILIRQLVLGEAVFKFRRKGGNGGRPGEMWGDDRLSLLEKPWHNGTTGELIARMEQDTSLTGNFYATRVGTGPSLRLRRLRPDWVTIITGVRREELNHPDERPTPWDIRAQVIAYSYQPPGEQPTIISPERMVHYSPIPDPQAQWMGMSWITSIVREIEADKATTKHKLKYFDNNASSGLIISYDPSVKRDQVSAFAEQFRDQYEGLDKAYATIHVGGGADPKTVGANLRQLDFKVTQGAGESRMAAASLVGAVVAQLSEGMAGSALNAGNFKAAARRFADIGARPLWRIMSGSLEHIVGTPSDSRLWYDDRDISFLQDDAKELAEIQFMQARTVAVLIREGFTADSAVTAVLSDDIKRLDHSGLTSVQLQPPITDDDGTEDGDED